MDAGGNFALQTTAKKRQTVIGTHQLPIQWYHQRPPTMHCLATLHNITDGWQTDGWTTECSNSLTVLSMDT